MKREEMLNLPPREWVEHLLDNEIFSLDMWGIYRGEWPDRHM